MDTPARFTLTTRYLGALPVVGHFAGRMGLHRLLDAWVPADDARLALDPAVVIAAVVANLAIEHRPLYARSEWAAVYEPSLLLLGEDGPGLLNDDRVGRMLDRLFQADRGSLLTELMVGVIAEFGIDCSRLHNDSTSVSVHGTYQAADGEDVAGTPAPAIMRGHSKDHRPDLKQLVFILTVSGDHAVPVIYRLADGNTSDDPTRIPTWDQLVRLTGGPGFLYAADCKLASEEAMGHIHRGGGRFITVLPRSRKEDAAFRAWMQDHEPGWAEALRAPGRIGEPDQVLVHLPGAVALRGGVPRGVGARQRQAAPRRRRPCQEDREGGGGDRRRPDRAAVLPAEPAADRRGGARRRRGCPRRLRRRALGPLHGDREDPGIIPADPRRPGPDTGYRRIEKKTFEVTCDIDYQQVACDAVSDGCWPLITNDRDMTGAEVLAAYRYQPNLERRHHLLKGVQDAAPIWIKTIPRIEAIFLCHFIALLIGALIERQIRMAMKAAEIARIPVYPELRGCAAPSADRIFEIFAHVARHELRDATGALVQVFEPEFTELQLKILDLLDVPVTAYTKITEPCPRHR